MCLRISIFLFQYSFNVSWDLHEDSVCCASSQVRNHRRHEAFDCSRVTLLVKALQSCKRCLKQTSSMIQFRGVTFSLISRSFKTGNRLCFAIRCHYISSRVSVSIVFQFTRSFITPVFQKWDTSFETVHRGDVMVLNPLLNSWRVRDSGVWLFHTLSVVSSERDIEPWTSQILHKMSWVFKS